MLTGIVDQACGAAGLGVVVTKIWNQPPVRFDPDCIDCVREAAEVAGFATRDIISGAGHDAAYIVARRPDRDDLRAVPRRHQPQRGRILEPEQCAAGAQVLLEAVLNYDRRLAEQFSGTG